MEQEHGEEITQALAPYQGVTSLTQEQATTILRTIWPKAPDVEVFKAAVICQMYGLNPLMKHLHLVEYKKWRKLPGGGREPTGESTWVSMLGIGATRLIASRDARYSYIAGPRIMTEQEQTEIRGEFDPETFWAITILRDEHGNEAPGYGSWPKAEIPHGDDKGNTGQNMAFIRSERQAFDRLLPGKMPQGVEVGDIQFLPGPEPRPALKHGSILPPKKTGNGSPLSTEQWRWFYAQLKELGHNEVSAKQELGIRSFNADWVGKGRTLEEALEKLGKHVGTPVDPGPDQAELPL